MNETGFVKDIDSGWTVLPEETVCSIGTYETWVHKSWKYQDG